MRYAFITGTALGGVFAYITAGPFILITQLGVATEHFGLYHAVMVLTYLAGSLFARQLATAIRPQTLLMIGLIIAVTSSVLLCVVVYGGYLTPITLTLATGAAFFGMGPMFAVAPVLALGATRGGAGTAAALIGSIEMLTASLAATSVTVFHDGTARPYALTMLINALTFLVVGAPRMNTVPTTGEVREFLTFLDELAALSAAKILPLFRAGTTVDNKAGESRFDPVTAADREAEQALRDAIEKRYPEHGIVGEEFGVRSGNSPYTWLIDPIDGTRGFVAGLPTWGTLISLCQHEQALIRHDEPNHTLVNATSAARWAPICGTTTANAKLRHERVIRCPMPCCAATHPQMFTVGAEADAFARLAAAVQDTRYGTDCYGYCALALGQVDLVVEATLQVYGRGTADSRSLKEPVA